MRNWVRVGDRPDIRFALGLDGISLWLFMLTSLLMITAICALWELITERVAAHYAFPWCWETGLLGLFASLDIILVLHLLRVHADPPVLPDRDLGRPATASCSR